MPQPFDPHELMDRLDNDREFLADTVRMLDTDGRALLADIRNALAAADAPAVARAAHTLKGMISNFCAPDAHAAAFLVERLAKSGDLSTAPAAVAALDEQLEALLTALAAFLQTTP